jgi:hypothetical protein
MKMKDDFIYKALPKVRKDFARSLYTKISTAPRYGFQSRMYSLRKIPTRSQVAMIVLGVLVLVAWSQVRLWIRYVPIGDLWLIEFSPSTEQVPRDRLMPPIVPTSPPRWRGFYVNLSPDWIPDGFSATRIPDSGYSYEEIIGMWSNDQQETIRLFVVPKEGGARPYAPPGMYKEVRVNGQPAILVYGRLAPNSAENPQAQRKWDKTLGLQLSWSVKASICFLETLGPYVSEEDLIRMAESMKEVRAPEETIEITVP